MLSGRLASRIGTYDSGHEFTASSPTIMHYLRQRRYQTLDDRVRSGGKVKRVLQLDYDEETAFLGVQKICDLAR